MSFQLSPYSPLTLTLLLVTVGSTEARETAAIVVCQKVLEMREEHTVYVYQIMSQQQQLTVQVPPFMQGLGSHSFVSLSQLTPSNPAAHRHSY